MTDPIQDFYTRHPYPPPVENLDRARDEWHDPNRHRAEFHLFWPERPYRADLDILVAGCGTWQAARYAVTHPDARVTGIDVSATSIEHTRQLKQKHDLTNLELCQLPIEHAGELARDFDLIVCTGVLHHLADPDAGLRALRSVLRPDGVMYLMVYAPYGRAGAYMLQEYCRRLGLGLGTSEQEIQDLITTLEALPPHHPLAALLRGARDARNPDALADALLNPRDRAYSVPQFFELFDRGGIALARWYWQAPYLPQCGAIAATPHAHRLSGLPEREQFATMELWRGTMTAHSAIVRHRDATANAVAFHGDAWRRYVPIRLPWTHVVQERLPPRAAAVLLNRSHAFPDLILAVDEQDKRLFDGIDGRRPIAAIAEQARDVEPNRVRAFFEALWRYDQVVFDVR